MNAIPLTARFEYIAVSIGDLDCQARFYGDVFSIAAVQSTLRLPDAGLRSTIRRSATGVGLELIERRGSVKQSPHDVLTRPCHQGYTHLALRVHDLDTAADAVVQAGGTLVSPPTPALRPRTRYAYLRDPDNNLIELVAGT
jgi:catechol 2,3-dioxygenase-like lactoylglutathione lyase family enzyme